MGRAIHYLAIAKANGELFCFLFVPLLELVDTSCRIHQHILTGEEGVRSIRNFQFDQGIFIAIFPFDRFPRLGRRTAQKGITIAHILKNNEPVIAGMETFFHNLFFLKVVRILPYSFQLNKAAKVSIYSKF